MSKTLQRGKATSFALVALMFGCAAGISGCSRTDDGSIMVERPNPSLGFGSMSERIATRWGMRREEPEETTSFPTPPPYVVEAEPVAPVAAAPVYRPRTASRTIKAVAPRFKPMRVGVKAPFQATAENAKPLTCSNTTQPGGRVKVSCE